MVDHTHPEEESGAGGAARGGDGTVGEELSTCGFWFLLCCVTFIVLQVSGFSESHLVVN